MGNVEFGGSREHIVQRFADGLVVRGIIDGQRATAIVRPEGVVLVRRSIELDQNPTEYGDIYLFKGGRERKILEIVRPAPIVPIFTIVPPIDEETNLRGQPIVGIAKGQALDLALALEMGITDSEMLTASKRSTVDPSVADFIKASLAV